MKAINGKAVQVVSEMANTYLKMTESCTHVICFFRKNLGADLLFVQPSLSAANIKLCTCFYSAKGWSQRVRRNLCPAFLAAVFPQLPEFAILEDILLHVVDLRTSHLAGHMKLPQFKCDTKSASSAIISSFAGNDGDEVYALGLVLQNMDGNYGKNVVCVSL